MQLAGHPTTESHNTTRAPWPVIIQDRTRRVKPSQLAPRGTYSPMMPGPTRAHAEDHTGHLGVRCSRIVVVKLHAAMISYQRLAVRRYMVVH